MFSNWLLSLFKINIWFKSFKLTDITQTFNARHFISLHKFQTSSSSRWDESQTILFTKSIDKTDRISTSNNWSNSLFSSADNWSHDWFTTISELWDLKHTDWTIPEDWVWSFDYFSEVLTRNWSHIETLEIRIKSLCKFEGFRCCIGFHLFGCYAINSKVQLDPFLFGFLDNLMQKLLVFG